MPFWGEKSGESLSSKESPTQARLLWAESSNLGQSFQNESA